MEELKKLLETHLDTENGNVLASQLAEIEAWKGLVASKHREAVRILDEQRRKLMLFDRDEKGNKLTEDTRKVRLAGLVSQEKELADLYGDYADIIKSRVSLGQTILKSIQAEMSGGLR